jgi:TRAP-type C4-dicarboxylate transport system substrate-binding protein
MMQALGATPVTIDSSETYLALQQKAVDGLDFPLPDLEATRIYQVVK